MFSVGTVVFFIYLFESIVGDMSIDLGSGNRGMSEESLDTADISAVLKKVGGKTVTKCVRMNIFYNPCR